MRRAPLPNFRICPVCLRRIRSTSRLRRIQHHRDSIGANVCPMSGEPYDLADTCDVLGRPA